MPIAAGILSIVCGGADLLVGILLCFIAEINWYEWHGLELVVAIPAIVLGIVAIIGGMPAITRENRGVALAGAVCAAISPLFFLGIVAVILLALSAGEFGNSEEDGKPPSVSQHPWGGAELML